MLLEILLLQEFQGHMLLFFHEEEICHVPDIKEQLLSSLRSSNAISIDLDCSRKIEF